MDVCKTYRFVVLDLNITVWISANVILVVLSNQTPLIRILRGPWKVSELTGSVLSGCP